jgi:hypothetical protein
LVFKKQRYNTEQEISKHQNRLIQVRIVGQFSSCLHLGEEASEFALFFLQDLSVLMQMECGYKDER